MKLCGIIPAIVFSYRSQVTSYKLQAKSLTSRTDNAGRFGALHVARLDRLFALIDGHNIILREDSRDDLVAALIGGVNIAVVGFFLTKNFQGFQQGGMSGDRHNGCSGFQFFQREFGTVQGKLKGRAADDGIIVAFVIDYDPLGIGLQ